MSSSARKLKDQLWAFFEALWAIGFAMAGRLSRRTVERWSTPGGQRVWVIAPHPDDEAIGCAGVMLLHRHRNDEVCVVYVTDGRRSRALGLGPDEMTQRRKQEALASLASLGIKCFEWLGLSEGEWQVEQLSARLASLADVIAPDVIYAPSRVDFHPEHQLVAYVLARFLSETTLQPLMRVYQVHVPLTSSLTSLLADVSNVREQAGAARRAYVTQVESVSRTRRMRRYASAYYRTGNETEEFWQMSAQHYCELHRDDLKTWAANWYRGIRYRSFDDPLAYWRGRAERRQLVEMAYPISAEATREA